MAKRLILGARGTDTGLWVSKPTKSVDSSNADDFLVDTTRVNTQPIWKYFVNNPVLNEDQSRRSNVSTKFVAGYGVIGDGNGRYYYIYDINHNLGYVPLCHMSVASDYAGDPYPTMYIDSTKIRLEYVESQTYENFLIPNGSYYLVASMPGSVTIPANFHFTLFRQRLP